jgi:hypothetical protein
MNTAETTRLLLTRATRRVLLTRPVTDEDSGLRGSYNDQAASIWDCIQMWQGNYSVGEISEATGLNQSFILQLVDRLA